jgi:hypothetical protein
VRNGSGQLHAQELGTYGLSTVAGRGALELRVLTPWTMTLHYGPLGPDGTVDVCLTHDQRVCDAASVAGTLADLEDVLKGEIVNELGYLRDLEAA